MKNRVLDGKIEELEEKMALTGWWKLWVDLIALFSSMQWSS